MTDVQRTVMRLLAQPGAAIVYNIAFPAYYLHDGEGGRGRIPCSTLDALRRNGWVEKEPGSHDWIISDAGRWVVAEMTEGKR